MTKRDLEYFKKIRYKAKSNRCEVQQLNTFLVNLILIPNNDSETNLEPLFICMYQNGDLDDITVQRFYHKKQKELNIFKGFVIKRNFNPKGHISDFVSKSTWFLRKLIDEILEEDQIRTLSSIALQLVIENKTSLSKDQSAEIDFNFLPFIDKAMLAKKYTFISTETLDSFAINEILNYKETRIKKSLTQIKNKELIRELNYVEICPITEESKITRNKIENLMQLSIRKQNYEEAVKYRDLVEDELREKFIQDWPNIKPIDLTYLDKRLP